MRSGIVFAIAVRQQMAAAGADLNQDLPRQEQMTNGDGFSDLTTTKRSTGRGCAHKFGKKIASIPTAPMDAGCGTRGADSLEHATDMMTRRSRRWRSGHFMSQPLITTAITWITAEDWLCERFQQKTKAFIER